MAITVIRDLAATDQADTIGDLIDSGLHYTTPIPRKSRIRG